jgi:protein SCO1/2
MFKHAMRKLIGIIIAFVLLSFAAVRLLAPEWMAPQPGTVAGGKALIGGPFVMTDHHGNRFTERDLAGKYALVFFGFTHCPDICPTTLLTIAEVMDQLGDDAKKVLPVFVSVDPKRDTVGHLSNYVQNFHPSVIGLTGTEEQVKQIADTYKVYYAIRETEDSAMGYQVDHSGYLYFMGPNGEYIAHFPHNVTAQVLREAILKQLKG